MTSAPIDVRAEPPEGYLPGQEKARALLEDPDGPIMVLLSGGQGAGKTYWLAMEGARLHLLNLQSVLAQGGTANDVWGIALAPTHGLMQKGLGMALDDVFTRAGLGGRYSWNKMEGILRFDFGGGIYFFTAEQPDRIIAVNGSYVLIDEPGTPKKGDAFVRCMGRLRGKGAYRKVAMAGTPEDIVSRQWFYDLIASPEAQAKWGEGGANERRVVFASTRENEFIQDLEGYLRGQMSVLTKAQAQAYIDGLFVAFNVGRVYSAFIDRPVDAGGHRIPEGHGLLNPPGRGNRLYLSLDFNVDPMCGVIACDMGDDAIRVLDEIRVPKSGAEEGQTPIGRWCDEAIARWVARWDGPVHVHGDATAERANVAASRSGWAMVHDRLRPVVQAKDLDYQVGVWGSNPREIDRVNTVNAAFEQGRVLISERCVWLRKDLNLVGFKEGTSQIDKTDPGLTHLSDALGYLIVQKQGVMASRAAGALPKVTTLDVRALGETFDWGGRGS